MSAYNLLLAVQAFSEEQISNACFQNKFFWVSHAKNPSHQTKNMYLFLL